MRRKFPLVPISLFIGLFLFISWYALSGLETVIQMPYISVVFWSISILSLAAVIYTIQRMGSKGTDSFFQVSTHFFLIFFVSELVFALLLLVGDIYRGTFGIFNLIVAHNFLSPARSPYWIGFSLSIFITFTCLFLYGILRGKYAYRVIRHQLYFDDLPPSFDGFTISQISDVHAGSFTNARSVQKGIDLIKAQNSDLFVFTGDLVNNKAEEIKPWISYFSQIKAPHGQFSILGNHDYGDYVKWNSEYAKRENLEQLKKYHADLGFRLLLDEHVTIQKNGASIKLLGVENWGLGFGERGNVEKALSGTSSSDFKILLSHDPSHWETIVKKHPSKIDLTLAGHTHGMQFGIEAFGVKWSPVKYRYKHWAGVKEENRRVLNVNRGFGFIGFSGRVGIWPEITVIELKRASSNHEKS